MKLACHNRNLPFDFHVRLAINFSTCICGFFLANCSLFYPNAREFEDDVHPMLYIENGFEKNATIHMFVSPYRELVNRII